MLTISVVDPQKLFRDALRALLEKDGEFVVAAEGGNASEALRIAERVRPDLLLLELALPDLPGIEVLKHLRGMGKVKGVVVTSESHGARAMEALREGAAACVLKEEGADELLLAMRQAIAGDTYLSRTLRSQTLMANLRPATVVPPNQGLSQRERAVLELVAEGLTNSETADRLKISRRTVESHRANVMQKLGLKTQAELIRYAIRNRIVPM